MNKVLLISLLISMPVYGNSADRLCFSENIAQAKRFNECKKTALTDNADAQFNVAAFYERGNVVTKNMSTAALWYTKAAKQGHVLSQFNLGNMYSKGDGVELNMKKSIHWWTKAAEKQNLQSIKNLASMYAFGLYGVDRNDKKAVYWYKKGAMLNDGAEQFNLAVSFANGLGLIQDYTQAYAFYNLGLVS